MKVRDGDGQFAGEEILGEVDVGEGGAFGDGGREGAVEVVVVEYEGGEAGEAAEEGWEYAGEVEGGEVEGDDVPGGVAKDAVPLAGGVVAGVPGGERTVWIIERVLGL